MAIAVRRDPLDRIAVCLDHPYREFVMTRSFCLSRLMVVISLLLLLGSPSGHEALAQGRNRFEIPENTSSEDNQALKTILERFPDSDADGDGVLTSEEARTYIEARREQWQQERQERRGRGRRRRIQATHSDIAYGDHDSQQIDLYLAPQSEDEDAEPIATPLVVYFHGRQFITGDEDDIQIDLRELLDSGISIASVNYRLPGEAIFPASFEDAARAIQFLRLNAEQYNLNPARLATAGHDAGGNLALYVALHDDLAVRERSPGNDEPRDEVEDPYDEAGLARQSTRVSAAVVWHALASYDTRFWEENDLPLNNYERTIPTWLDAEMDPLRDPEVIEIVEDISPIALASSSDPPVLLQSSYPDLEIRESTSWTIMAHHPKQSILLYDKLRHLGSPAVVRYQDMPDAPDIGVTAFFITHLGLQ